MYVNVTNNTQNQIYLNTMKKFLQYPKPPNLSLADEF